MENMSVRKKELEKLEARIKDILPFHWGIKREVRDQRVEINLIRKFSPLVAALSFDPRFIYGTKIIPEFNEDDVISNISFKPDDLGEFSYPKKFLEVFKEKYSELYENLFLIRDKNLLLEEEYLK